MSSKTLTAAIKEDHDEMYEYWTAYKKALAVRDIDMAQKWVNQLRWEVARHAAAEEIVVYPLMERNLGEKGRKLADHDRAEHQQVKTNLVTLERLEVGTPEFDRLMNQVMDHLKHHNDDEERDDLPALEPTLGDENSHKAAQTFSRTKNFVPTRAHPSAPNKPPYETLVGFLALPIDTIRDWFDSWPSSDDKLDAEEDYEEHGGRKQLEDLKNIS
ncbi:HHE domain-containing protein [Auricularia subglabra TFB-10046 SS5]|nr:HHE domain-containing protein [Auricularia subglabra TFB-10046 SS5]